MGKGIIDAIVDDQDVHPGRVVSEVRTTKGVELEVL